MTLENIIKSFADKGCLKLYTKTLAANDNSKNQVYLGGSFDILNIFPFSNVTADNSGDWEKTRFKTSLDFHWITDAGNLARAPNAQLILYPKYPEVRFSGFLQGCSDAPSNLMANRLENRILFFGIDPTGKVLGLVIAPNSPAADEFNKKIWNEEHGVFKIIPVKADFSEMNCRKLLLEQLQRIHRLGWINSKRLGSDMEVLACNSTNCGGYTLEAELGITPNGYSEPDFLGWEIKQFGVKAFDKLNSSRITLMTPEPTSGLYKEKGVETFIRKFGYNDKRGRPDRLNFGGIHKVGERQKSTGLTMHLLGFDEKTGKIRDTLGSIALVSDKDEIAAAWSFTSLLNHWGRKHAHASYVPSVNRNLPDRQYSYGNQIILGTGTRFDLFLQQMSLGNIFYDPGIKMENISTKPKVKRRSQFRVTSRHLPSLYQRNEILDLCSL